MSKTGTPRKAVMPSEVVEFRYEGSSTWRKAGIDGWRVKSAMRAGAEFDAKLVTGEVVHIRPANRSPRHD